jgi:hypothetical protein
VLYGTEFKKPDKAVSRMLHATPLPSTTLWGLAGDPSMGDRYRERIDDARLNPVTGTVRGWLFSK